MFSVTDVSKVSSWRAVQKLIEEVPTSFGGFVANYFSSQWTIFVAGTNVGKKYKLRR